MQTSYRHLNDVGVLSGFISPKKSKQLELERRPPLKFTPLSPSPCVPPAISSPDINVHMELTVYKILTEWTVSIPD